MIHKDPDSRIRLLYPLQQSVLVSMAAERIDLGDLSAHLDLLSEELYKFCSFEKFIPDCTLALISDKQHSALRSPQIVFEVMPDPSGFAHS